VFASCVCEKFVRSFGQLAVAAFFSELSGEFVVFCAEALAVTFFADDYPYEQSGAYQTATELDDIGSLRDAEYGQRGGCCGLDIVGHSEVRITRCDYPASSQPCGLLFTPRQAK